MFTKSERCFTIWRIGALPSDIMLFNIRVHSLLGHDSSFDLFAIMSRSDTRSVECTSSIRESFHISHITVSILLTSNWRKSACGIVATIFPFQYLTTLAPAVVGQ